MAKAKTKVVEEERKVEFPEVMVNGMVLPREKLKITSLQMQKILGWETEEQYKERMKKEHPDSKKAQEAEFGDDYLVKDCRGNKVRCWNNSFNRPFTESHALELKQVILNKDFCFNGESMIVSRTGLCQSIQHRGVGLILAVDEWLYGKEETRKHWREIWPEEPYIEGLLVCGTSDDPKSVMTLDNVRPRSLTDVVYTSETFSRKKMGTAERKECCRMLAVAIDFLWKRTGRGMKSIVGNTYHKFQTHSESLRFLDQHPTILDCVSEVFSNNTKRELSKLMLSPGTCAGAMYLMSISKSDPDEYREMVRADADKPEKALNWDLFGKATEFWCLIGTSADFSHVRDTLKGLAKNETADEGLGGRLQEKLAVLALAWAFFCEAKPNEVIHSNVVSLAGKYMKNNKGIKMLNCPEANFGGIDLGDIVEKEKEGEEETEVSEEEKKEEMERLKAERLERIKAAAQKVKERREEKKATGGNHKEDTSKAKAGLKGGM